MQKTMIAVKLAIDYIAGNGVGFAGQILNHGNLGVYTRLGEYDKTVPEYYLLWLTADCNSPVRRVVQDADGSYRVASPHFAPALDATGISLEEAVVGYTGFNSGTILAVVSFGTPPVAVVPEVKVDQVQADAIMLGLVMAGLQAKQYLPVVIGKETKIALVNDSATIEVYELAADGNNIIHCRGDSSKAAEYLIELADKRNTQPAIGTKRLQKNRDIIEACLKANGVLVDGHGNGDGTTRPTHIALFGTPGRRELVVALYEDQNFCINQIDLEEDGRPVVTSNSVGGNLFQPELPMVDRIHTYSDFSGNMLWNLVALTK